MFTCSLYYDSRDAQESRLLLNRLSLLSISCLSRLIGRLIRIRERIAEVLSNRNPGLDHYYDPKIHFALYRDGNLWKMVCNL